MHCQNGLSLTVIAIRMKAIWVHASRLKLVRMDDVSIVTTNTSVIDS
jgi:hypothetical protein